MTAGTGFTGTIIVIRDLSAMAVVGIHDHERESAQPLMMQLEIEFPACRATATDDICDTVDYAQIVTDLRLWLRGTRFFLLERLADALIDRVFTRFGAWRVSAQVMKGPILEGVGGVGVRLERLAPTLRNIKQDRDEEDFHDDSSAKTGTVGARGPSARRADRGRHIRRHAGQDRGPQGR